MSSTFKLRPETLLAEARAVHDAADREHRDLTPDERTRFDGLMARAKQATADAEQEFEVRAAVARLLGTGDSTTRPTPDGTGRETRGVAPKTDRAVLVPSMSEYRAQGESVDTAGGFTVPDEVSPLIIDRLRPASVFLAAGPRLFTMSSDVLRVPKIGTSATVAMVSENAAIPESDIVFAAAVFQARKLAGLTRSSNEWLLDSIGDARVIVEQDLLRQMGTKLDEQLFAGSGVAPNVLGIINQVGVTSTAITGPLTLDAVSSAIGRIEADNARANAIFLSPAVWSSVSRLKDAQGRYQLGPDPSADSRRQLFGVPVYVTPHVGNIAVVADMSQVGVGVRDRWTTHFDPYRFAEFDQTAIRVTSRWDMQVLNVAAVELLTGLTV